MKKPGHRRLRRVRSAVQQGVERKAGKKQYLVPYFIASHPGSDLDAMIDLAVFLKRNHYRPDQVQDFIPSPFDIAACMYHTGLDPFTQEAGVCGQASARPATAAGADAVLQAGELFRGPPALEQAGRQDLIGSGCDCLIAERPPKAALDRRRAQARRELAEDREGDHIRGQPGAGYRPHRSTQSRRCALNRPLACAQWASPR